MGGVNQLTVSGKRVINARVTRAKHMSSVNEGGGDDGDADPADNADDDDTATDADDTAEDLSDIIEATSSATNVFHSFRRPSNLRSSDCAIGTRRLTNVEAF